VSGVDQFGDDGRPGEAGASGDEDVHGFLLRSLAAAS